MDDENAVRTVVAEMLRVIGYQPTTVEDGERAVAAYRDALENDQRFDVVILDLTIRGGVGGVVTAGRILDLDPTAKVVVSSGYSHDPVMAEYRTHGFSGVMAKPYNIEKLSSVLQNMVQSKA
jgi:CheY-like chemotaxis protein